mgnify:CR=1 FL=1
MIKPMNGNLGKVQQGGFIAGYGHVYVGDRFGGVFLSARCNYEIYSNYDGPDWLCDPGIAICIGRSGISDVLLALKELVRKLEGGDLDMPRVFLPASSI